MTEVLVTKEPHRLVTQLVESFGPIFKLRVLSFHVRARMPCFCLLWTLPGKYQGAGCYAHLSSRSASHAACLHAQVVVITDPVRATQVSLSCLFS